MPPMMISFLFFGYFSVATPTWTQVGQSFDKALDLAVVKLPQLALAGLFILLTLFLARFTRRVIKLAMSRTKAELHVQSFVAQSGYISVWVLGIGFTISWLSINLSTLFAALGLTGAAIGFAIRDVIANLVAGIVLMSVRPFKIGDTIVVETFEGTVEAVEIYGTTLKTADGKQVVLPNAKVFGANVTNLSTYPTRRVTFTVKIASLHKPETVFPVLRDVLANVSGILNDPAPTTRLLDFTADASTLEITFWLNTQTHSLLDLQTEAKEKVRTRMLAERILLV